MNKKPLMVRAQDYDWPGGFHCYDDVASGFGATMEDAYAMWRDEFCWEQMSEEQRDLSMQRIYGDNYRDQIAISVQSLLGEWATQ